MSYIIYPQENNKLAVVFPCIGATKTIETEIQVPVINKDGEPTGEITTQIHTETVELTIEDIAAKDVPANTPYAIVESIDNIDNDYYDGYIYADGAAVPDINKCKAIHLDKFRLARKSVLEALDVEYMRALEVNDTVKLAEIAVKKQELRDITSISLPDTIEELKQTWPAILEQ